MAALTAGRAGARVMLVDQDEIYELHNLANVMLLPRTTVLGNYDHNVTTLLQTGKNTAWRECLWTVRPKKTLLASGAIEQGMIFQNNDRPGIMLAGAVRHYLNRYAVVSGNKAVLTTNNDTAYQTVFDLARARTPTGERGNPPTPGR